MTMDPKKVRIVFMGTPGFAVESLRLLVANGYQVVGVVTAPDKPAGRGLQLSQSPVKQFALEAGIPVLQPMKLKDPGFLDQLKQFRPDLQIVVAFRMLPEVVWSLPALGTFNLHASLLPQYRGAAPINHVIMNGETQTGVTTFLLSHEIDTGKIIFSRKVAISEEDTAGDLHDRLMAIGSELVLKTIDALAEGSVVAVSQDNLVWEGMELKTAPKLFRENLRIDWERPVGAIRNHIRGLSPYPGAWTTIVNHESGQATEMKVFAAGFCQGKPAQAGAIESDGKTYLRIAGADGWLSVTDLQISGKKRMKTPELLRGFSINAYGRAK